MNVCTAIRKSFNIWIRCGIFKWWCATHSRAVLYISNVWHEEEQPLAWLYNNSGWIIIGMIQKALFISVLPRKQPGPKC
jgi:hypothetical protein